VASADTVPALLVLGATVHFEDAEGGRDVPLADLYQEDGIQPMALRQDEVLTDVTLPEADGWRSTYLKMRDRGSFDFPIAAVAAAVRWDGAKVSEARIAITALGSRPQLVADAAAPRGSWSWDATRVWSLSATSTPCSTRECVRSRTRTPRAGCSARYRRASHRRWATRSS